MLVTLILLCESDLVTADVFKRQVGNLWWVTGKDLLFFRKEETMEIFSGKTVGLRCKFGQDESTW